MRAGAFMVPLRRTKGATPTRAARRLVADETEFRHCRDRGERGLVADAFDRLQEPLGVAQLVTLMHELHHSVMSFAISLAQGLQMSRDLVPDAFGAPRNDDCVVGAGRTEKR